MERYQQRRAASWYTMCLMLESLPYAVPRRYQGICPHLDFPKRRPQTRVQGQVAYREVQVTPVEKGDVIQEGRAAYKGCVITATMVGTRDIIPRKMLGNPDLQNTGLRIIPPRKGYVYTCSCSWGVSGFPAPPACCACGQSGLLWRKTWPCHRGTHAGRWQSGGPL